MEIVEALRIILGSIYVMLVPGLAWSFAFFDPEEIDWIERIALSIGLSISIVPILIFYLNFLFKVPINFWTSSATIAVTTLAGTGFYWKKEEITSWFYDTRVYKGYSERIERLEDYVEIKIENFSSKLKELV